MGDLYDLGEGHYYMHEDSKNKLESIRFEFITNDKGEKYNDTCISELVILTYLDGRIY